MPRFHLNQLGSVEAADEHGHELPDLDAARAVVVAGVRAVIAADLIERRPSFADDRIEITDETGIVLETVKFGGLMDLIR